MAEDSVAIAGVIGIKAEDCRYPIFISNRHNDTVSKADCSELGDEAFECLCSRLFGRVDHREERGLSDVGGDGDRRFMANPLADPLTPALHTQSDRELHAQLARPRKRYGGDTLRRVEAL
ncbi:MAG: hypothetical protein ACJ8AI_09210 [Rhodopila sp.]